MDIGSHCTKFILPSNLAPSICSPPFYDIYFVNCICVDTRWLQYSTHLHTNNTQTSKWNRTHRTYI